MKKAELVEVRMIHVNQLAVKQDDFLEYLYKQRPIWRKKEMMDKFTIRIKDIINECMDDRADYMDGGNNGGVSYLTLTTKGKEYYSFSHLIRVFFSNSYIKAIILTILTLIVTNYITENVINKVSTAVITNQQVATSTTKLAK
jgi:hypothetical protein